MALRPFASMDVLRSLDMPSQSGGLPNDRRLLDPSTQEFVETDLIEPQEPLLDTKISPDILSVSEPTQSKIFAQQLIFPPTDDIEEFNDDEGKLDPLEVLGEIASQARDAEDIQETPTVSSGEVRGAAAALVFSKDSKKKNSKKKTPTRVPKPQNKRVNPPLPKKRGPTRGAKPKERFPLRLFDLLRDGAKKHIAKWGTTEDGQDTVDIVSTELLGQALSLRVDSLYSDLRKHGFRRLETKKGGIQCDSWFNESFNRDNRSAAGNIYRRMTVKQDEGVKVSDKSLTAMSMTDRRDLFVRIAKTFTEDEMMDAWKHILPLGDVEDLLTSSISVKRQKK